MTRPAFLGACSALLCTLASPGAAVPDLGDEPASGGLGTRRTPVLVARIPRTPRGAGAATSEGS